MIKQKTTKNFADWALRTLKEYEKGIDKTAVLVLSGIADTRLQEKTNALELLTAMFVYQYGTPDERKWILAEQDMHCLGYVLKKYKKDENPKKLDDIFQSSWDFYLAHLLCDKESPNK